MPDILGALLHILLLLAAAPIERSLATGWTATTSQNYEAGIDRTAAHSGVGSLYLKSQAGDAAGYAARQRIRADAYRGKKIKISAWLRAAPGGDGGALWLRIDMKNGDYILDGMLESAPADWKEVSIVASIPADAAGLTFGLRMRGKGQVWMDDVTIEPAPPAVPTTTIERRKDPTQKDAGAVYKATPVNPVNLDFEQR